MSMKLSFGKYALTVLIEDVVSNDEKTDNGQIGLPIAFGKRDADSIIACQQRCTGRGRAKECRQAG